MLKSFDPRFLLRVFCALAFLAWLAGFAQDTILYRHAFPDVRHKIWLLDVSNKQGIFAWFSVEFLFVAGGLLLWLGNGTARRGERFVAHWYLLSAVFLGLSFDEFVRIHVKLAHRLIDMDGPRQFLWLLPYVVGAAGGFIAYLPFIRSFPPAIMRRMLLSAAVYFGGAVGMEWLNAAIMGMNAQETLGFRIFNNLEEGMEVAGTAIFISALLAVGENRRTP